MKGLAELWRAGQLCDVVIVTTDNTDTNGEPVFTAAHKVVLAAASGYFHALFLGAGACMRAAHMQHQQQHAPGQQQQVVELAEVDAEHLRLVLSGIYEDGQPQLHPSNLEPVLRLATFLDVPCVLDACVAYMRQALCDANAVPLLTLSSRYSLHLKRELMTYVCTRFSRLSQQHCTAKLLQAGLACSSAPQPISLPLSSSAAAAGELPGSWGHPSSSSSSSGHMRGRRAAAAAAEQLHSSTHMAMSAGSNAAGSGSWNSTPGRYMLLMHQQHTQQRGQPAGPTHQTTTSGSTSGGSSTPAAAPAAAPAPRALLTQTLSHRHSSDCSTDDGAQQGTAEAAGEGAGEAHTLPEGSQLSALPHELLLEVLQSEELLADCELDVLQVVVDWVAVEPPTRLPELQHLMRAVQLDGLPLPLPDSLGAASPHHARVVAAVHALLQQHAGSSSLAPAPPTPTPGSPMHTTNHMFPPSDISRSPGQPRQHEQAAPGPAQPAGQHGTCAYSLAAGSRGGVVKGWGRPRRTQPTVLLAAGGHDSTWHTPKLVELYDPAAGSWLPGPSLPCGVSFAAAALLGRDVYMVGGTPIRSCVMRLVGGCSHWEACPSLSLPRAHASLVGHAGSLFVWGGRSQVQSVQQVLPSMEVLTGSGWELGPHMSNPRTAAAAAALHGGLYAMGGQTTRATLASMERFDLGAEKWTTLSAALSTERKYGAGAVLGWRIYVVGGMDEARIKLGCVEALDPREGRWQQVAPLTRPRSSAGLAALQVGSHGRLFVAGGSAPGDQVHDGVEVYVPEMNAWMEVAPLSSCRSGLALCAA